MKPIRLLFAVLCLSILNAFGEAAPETFEDGIPDYFSATRPESLSLTGAHSKHGRQSLQWEWRGGEQLRIRHGLGNIHRVGGYGGTYSKSTFGIWIYNRRPDKQALLLEFKTKGKTGGSFSFPLNFRGWQRAHLRYTWKPQFNGKVSPETDTILIQAPANGAGTLCIDLLTYNGILDFRQQYVPKGKTWKRPPRDNELFPLPANVSLAEEAAVRLVEERFHAEAKGSAVVTPQVFNDLSSEFESWELARNPDGSLRGRPFVKSPGFYTELGLENLENPQKICQLMKRIAIAHANSGEAVQRQQLADWYLLLNEHLREQGMRPASGFGWNWYNGRDLATSTFLMRRVLREKGGLSQANDYFDSNYACSRIFDDTTIRPNMDYFHNDLRNIIRAALMQPSLAEQACSLRAVSRRLSKDILHQGHDGFRPDGSAFHHGFHYFAYANYSTNTLCSLLKNLSGTPFQISQPALNRLKQVLLNMRFYCNRTSLPLPLCGRHPHSQSLNTGKYADLAQAFLSATGQIDADLARAYLRFHPEKATAAPYVSQNLRPESTPRGELLMPHAGFLAIRRKEWSALIKGYSRYVRFGEIYANNNRYGRYLSNGYLDILAGGDPVSREASGCTAPGWDWNCLDGTTTVVLPPEKLKPKHRGTEFISTDEVFCGGAIQPDTAAIFGLVLHGNKAHHPSFRARKSYHWLPAQNLIVCLGSAIACDDREHRVQTTLFQKHLPDHSRPLRFSGREITEFPFQHQEVTGQVAWLLDMQNTGYLIPPGQALNVVRRHQKNPGQHDKKQTEGDFTCAWIDHGKSPQNHGYHYAVCPRMEKSDGLAKLANHLPYRLLRKDEEAHILEAESGGEPFVSAALFTAGTIIPATDHTPSLRLDCPALVILKGRGDNLCLTICDPDLRLDKGYRSQPRRTTITLQGDWKTEDPTPDAKVENGQTILQRSTSGGEPQTIRFRKR